MFEQEYQYKLSESELRRQLEDERKKTVFRMVRGHSMEPLIRTGEIQLIAPLSKDDTSLVNVGDIVVAKVGKRILCHIVFASNPDGSFVIGNNKGNINGVSTKVFGKVIGLINSDRASISIEQRKLQQDWQLPQK